MNFHWIDGNFRFWKSGVVVLKAGWCLSLIGNEGPVMLQWAGNAPMGF
jgi:hypothetical protein